MPDTLNIISEGVKYVATGLLGVLWWDVRKVRGMKDMIMKETKNLFLTPDNQEKYIRYEKHRDLCKINTHEIKDHINDKFSDMKDFIKKNGT